jgi:3-hydroxybutyryl-CoA dehydrogenase
MTSVLTGSTTPGRTIPAACAVIGGGRMGAGIAHALLLAGSSVQLVERDSDAAQAAVARVRRAVDASVARGLLEFADKAMTRLDAATSFADLGTVGLVVEAVPEDLDLKVTTLRAVEDMLSADAVIASNTSSISLATLGNSLAHPERLLGLHFFNPVPASKLVEIVIADRTTPQLRDVAVGWVKQLGKTPVVVRDTPGFASSRLGVLLGLEAIRMVEHGVASAEDIDAAMTLGYGHPVGPLRLTDLVGLDVRLGIARYLEQELGPQFRPPDLLVELVERGDLGQKTGRGFYEWDEEGKR